jgi:hypothetical protein
MLRVSIHGTHENFRKRPGAVLINIKEYAVDDLLPNPFHLVPQFLFRVKIKRIFHGNPPATSSLTGFNGSERFHL